MISPVIGHSVWKIKMFFVNCDVIMKFVNMYHCLVFYYVAPVTTVYCEQPDRMSV
jgi:hypothetical protein